MVYDFVTKHPSITITFPYITFFVWIYAVILLIQKDVLEGTLVALFGWIVATVLYMIRKLNKAKIDLTQKSVEFEGGDDADKNG